MAYEKELDECLVAKSWENPNEKLTVSIFSYNKGTKKLQISRETKDTKGGLKYAKLGRMTKEEIMGLLPLIKEVAEQMD